MENASHLSSSLIYQELCLPQPWKVIGLSVQDWSREEETMLGMCRKTWVIPTCQLLVQPLLLFPKPCCLWVLFVRSFFHKCKVVTYDAFEWFWRKWWRIGTCGNWHNCLHCVLLFKWVILHLNTNKRRTCLCVWIKKKSYYYKFFSVFPTSG